MLSHFVGGPMETFSFSETFERSTNKQDSNPGLPGSKLHFHSFSPLCSPSDIIADACKNIIFIKDSQIKFSFIISKLFFNYSEMIFIFSIITAENYLHPFQSLFIVQCIYVYVYKAIFLPLSEKSNQTYEVNILAIFSKH